MKGLEVYVLSCQDHQRHFATSTGCFGEHLSVSAGTGLSLWAVCSDYYGNMLEWVPVLCIGKGKMNLVVFPASDFVINSRNLSFSMSMFSINGEAKHCC